MEPQKIVIRITNIDPENFNQDLVMRLLQKALEQLDDETQDLSMGVHGDHHPQALDWIMTAYRKWQTPGTALND